MGGFGLDLFWVCFVGLRGLQAFFFVWVFVLGVGSVMLYIFGYVLGMFGLCLG